MKDIIERIPPNNTEAEQAVIGAMLLDREAVYEVQALLKGSDFYHPGHADLFETIVDIVDQGKPADMITVGEELRKRDLLEKVGGILYVAELANSTGTAANIKHYADIVKDKSLLRVLIRMMNTLSAEGYDPETFAEDLLDRAEEQILRISQERQNNELVSVEKALFDTVEKLEFLSKKTGDITGLTSGFRDIDLLTSGWQKSDLIIVAARPAMGKTAFCLNLAESAALSSKEPVAVFSLEMSRDQLAQRMISSLAEIDQQNLRSGRLRDEDWIKLAEAIGPLAAAPIYIDDTPAITVREIRAKARRLRAEKGLGLIVIDYLQLMSGGRRIENRQQEISEISRSLKGLARELEVPIIALSQLSRAVEQTADKLPNLSHLRESGALEQDADIVMFIYREDYYFPETERQAIADIIVAKHRNGPVGKISLGFRKEFTRFYNLAHREEGY